MSKKRNILREKKEKRISEDKPTIQFLVSGHHVGCPPKFVLPPWP
jgi:hypothetical protein